MSEEIKFENGSKVTLTGDDHTSRYVGSERIICPWCEGSSMIYPGPGSIPIAKGAYDILVAKVREMREAQRVNEDSIGGGDDRSRAMKLEAEVDEMITNKENGK